MRGDRPHSEFLGIMTRAATPHARGSTSLPQSLGPPWTGYPACAGIDLRFFQGSPASTWLPRMRGDRPRVPACACADIRATPHARGST